MRKFLAIVFLLIFSFQVIPMKAIGKLLSKGQTEEEVKHSCDGKDDCSDDAASYVDLIGHSYDTFTVTRLSLKVKIKDWRYTEDLPVAHIAEIPSPPPNSCA